MPYEVFSLFSRCAETRGAHRQRRGWHGMPGRSGIRVPSNFPDTPVVGFTESFVIYVNRSAPDMRIPGNR